MVQLTLTKKLPEQAQQAVLLLGIELRKSQDDLGLAVIRGPEVGQGDPEGFGQLSGRRGVGEGASLVRSG